MPLPDDSQTPWPLPGYRDLWTDMLEASAWYAGDPQRLMEFYGGRLVERPSVARRRRRAGTVERGWSWFWGRQDESSARQRVHVPAAADIAATSADLLFGDEPIILIPEAHQKNAPSEATEAEDRLAWIIAADGIANALLEAAEVAAAIGSVWLRPVWDTEAADHPMLTIVHGDHAFAEWRWGRPVAVTFWRELERTGSGHVWRHLERHEPGVIYHGLYFGSDEKLGVRRPLDSRPETKGLAVDETGAIQLPDPLRNTLLPAYVPNALPNRRRRGSPVGRPDTAGTETLMDALDETMSSWMRDIRLGKARLVVPHEYLDRHGRGRGATFDLDTEVFTPLDIDPAVADRAGITPVEFKLRTQEHATTCAELFERIVVTAGYSPQTFGLIGDVSTQTATEVRARENRSLRTTARKRRYWRPAIERTLELMLVLDREVFGSGVEPLRPRVEFAEPQPDPRDLAQTVELLRRARAASTETLVRMVRPDLEGDELAAEVERILREDGAIVEDPTGGAP
ncbi:MAG TPA: hypothetical protein VKZ72_00365 [Acidimicrobiales bacterium]|nr:hypothetical protein [Acidimicrobiales bacterium]